MKRTMVAVAVCLFAVTAGAATVNLTKDSDNGFTNAYGWASGKAPEAGNNYLVANGHYLRGDYSQGFAGDSLQFGIVGESEGVFFKEHVGTHTFTKLILANGYYRTWMSSNGQAAHICGAVEVTSPDSAPFRLHSTHNSGTGWYLTYWDAAFTGAEGTGLKVGPYPNALMSAGQTIFTGDNTSYLGSISAYGTNAVFAFTTGNSLGGALSSFRADAISLEDGTTLECQGADVALSSSLNRGITVKATGGSISVPSGKSLRIEWPITGSGALSKTGAGTLTLASAMSLSEPFVVDGGNVKFASGFSNAGSGGVSVASGGELYVVPGDEVEVSGLAFDGGAIRLSYDETTGESGVLTLNGECTGWPIPVYPLATRGLKVPFLKVPTSVKTVTASDFAKPEDLAATGLPSAKFTVETDGGMQTVYAEMSQIVTVASGSSQAFIYPTDANKWSDSKVMHAGADYSIGGGKKLVSWGMTGDYTIPGDSVTVAGTSSSKAQWDMGYTGNDLNRITGDVRAGNYALFRPTAPDGEELHLDGRLYVYGTAGSDSSLDFRSAKSGISLVIDSVVSGAGCMSFQPGDNYYTNTYRFTANNTYTGTYFLYGPKTATLTTLEFENAESWGSNPASFKDIGMTVQGKVVLHPIGVQTVDQPNRQIRFYSSGSMVRVDAGEMFELKSPIKFNNGGSAQYVASVTKIGGGTWAVGGSVTVDRNGLADWPRLTVEEGFIRPDNPIAFRNVAVTIGENGGVAAKYRPGETSDVATYGMIVTNAARFAVSGDTLKVKVETNGQKARASEAIAFLTVPEETAAVLDAKHIRFEHDDPADRSAVLVRDTLTYSGRPSVRYSCKFVRGMVITFR
ncbi:MAG: hypothetical protein IJG84_01790 [Kiritimatiellae bacterium]|nr:hypothetical protein [Kiritimatiellia bacterium]